MGGEELKWCQLAHHQLTSQQGPHFSPHSKAKAIYKSTNLRIELWMLPDLLSTHNQDSCNVISRVTNICTIANILNVTSNS